MSAWPTKDSKIVSFLDLNRIDLILSHVWARGLALEVWKA